MSPATKRDTFLSHKILRFSSEKSNLLPVQIFNNFIESKTPNYDYVILAKSGPCSLNHTRDYYYYSMLKLFMLKLIN